MKKITLFALAVLLFAGCQHREDLSSNTLSGELVLKSNAAAVPQGDPLSKERVDEIILNYLSDRKDFHWEWLSLQELWSVLQYDDHVVAVGYKPAGLQDISGMIHTIDVKSGAWKQVHDGIIEVVLTQMNKNSATPVRLEDILVDDDAVLPVITFKLKDRNAITALYNLENVRYLEPLGYWPAMDGRSTSGCSGSTEPLNAADFSTISPSSLLPWNFNSLNVPSAWNAAQGRNITIGVIDAGISSAQTLLGSGFNSGDSNVGRTLTTEFTYGSSAFTSCTHGTSMIGGAAGPRNASGATTGIAYRAGVHFIRACADVVLDESAERTGVRNALVRMGDRADVRIVSMSVGTPFASSTLLDGVNYCFNKGKMIMAAAGTSFSWTSWWGVVYPAAYSQCLAITGVKENGSTCSSCHDGSAVDFTVPMERNTNSSRNSLSLAASGNTPAYIGGSSIATANAAGIAALVWSVKPTLTRTQVYTCLRNTAFFYPSFSSSLGFGNLNAGAAVAMAQGM